VNDAICRRCTVSQDVEIVERASLNLGAGGRQGGGRSLRACKSKDAVTGREKLGDDRRAYVSGCPGNENTHEENLQKVDVSS
jgi:hypothetical protein